MSLIFISTYLFLNNQNYTSWRVVVWFQNLFFHKASNATAMCQRGTSACMPCHAQVVSYHCANHVVISLKLHTAPTRWQSEGARSWL
jgi:hypothetical protein